MIGGGVGIGGGLVWCVADQWRAMIRKRGEDVLLFYDARWLFLWRRVQQQRHVMTKQSHEDLQPSTSVEPLHMDTGHVP
jgi:hypothetical protein